MALKLQSVQTNSTNQPLQLRCQVKKKSVRYQYRAKNCRMLNIVLCNTSSDHCTIHSVYSYKPAYCTLATIRLGLSVCILTSKELSWPQKFDT